MTEKLTVLGSTGSVGGQALDVARHLGIRVVGLSAHSDIGTLEKQIREFKPEAVAVSDEKAAKDLGVKIADLSVKIISGKDAAGELASLPGSDTVLDSISGIAGMRPAFSAVRAGKRLALANKECLVALGDRLIREAKENGAEILPVDSEHSAIFQCLEGNRDRRIKKILLTASGGPFFGKSGKELKEITPADALAHPTWKMGTRITVDSATLMNKGFEVIEAVRLFGVTPEQVEVLVHRESIIHSMVEYTDNAVIAQLSNPDMRLCCQYALTYPERAESPIEELDLFGRSLTFEKPDTKAFPLLSLAYDAVKRGGVVPASMNGADEEAVSLFVSGKIGFSDIPELVTRATLRAKGKELIPDPTEKDVSDADREAREFVLNEAGKLGA